MVEQVVILAGGGDVKRSGGALWKGVIVAMGKGVIALWRWLFVIG